MRQMLHRFILVMLAAGLFTVPAGAGPPYNVIVVQHIKYIGFEQAKAGFTAHLKNIGYGNSVRIVEDFNALSDIAALEKKISEINARQDIDLIFSLGTHSTKRLVASNHITPIVFTIVGDPLESGIVANWKSSGRNYTGVETPAYYSTVVRLMHTFLPFKRLGMVYLEGSPSHEAGIAQIKSLSTELGFEFIYQGFPLRNQDRVPYPEAQVRANLERALEAVCARADAFFVQTSTTFTNEFASFNAAFEKHRIISAGDQTNLDNGLVMGIGKDARRFGEQCAQYAVQILEGTPPAALPMDAGTKLTIQVNLQAAKRIGYEPPFDLVSAADSIINETGHSVSETMP